MKLGLPLAVFTGLVGLTYTWALADQPPKDAKPVVEVVEALEKAGYGPFNEVSFDDGRWEVEALNKDGEPRELTVDPRSLEILTEHRDDAEAGPPRSAQPLSKILRSLVKAGHSNISEISFERRYWEIELHGPNGKRELLVDPTTAEIKSDRLDD